MNNFLSLRKSINKSFLKIRPLRSDIERFKVNLTTLLNHIDHQESEEFNKNVLIEFLKNTYYSPNYFVNTKGRNDLVIHIDKSAKDAVGVIIEAKRASNSSEMMKVGSLNTKALQELVLYYMRERITNNNLQIKHLIATNIKEWFIFDSAVFEKHFVTDKNFVKSFKDFETKQLSGLTTEFFYSNIAKPAIELIKNNLVFTHFNLSDYELIITNTSLNDDNKLIPLYKVLSPEHLLKKPFLNDSNSLNKAFYTELLHIIGLEESKEGGRKIIARKVKGFRYSGSLLENSIIQLESLDKLSRIPNIKQYGSSKDEQLFNVSIELAITWVNRILFLKLLEAQLKSYHKGNKRNYSFLNVETIKNFDELNTLFFQVLAVKPTDRNEDVKLKFADIPYLNSSLFEPSEIEHNTLFISNLSDEKKIPILVTSVLKNQQGKKLTGELNAIEYLFNFLNSYDFASDGNEDIQEDNKTLINASVLGLIFEKINGYKEGSFFTPGFVTMYMCRETLRKIVVSRFNEVNGWKCKTIDDVYNNLENTTEIRTKANETINNLKICDPAVGSGHFLVSALNELIVIKAELKILQDKEGKRLKEYNIEIANDELVISDEDGELIDYKPKNAGSQRLQETLFLEKQTIIENCLFGVDINPNSVKICRLRLWIELLKNAYYKEDGQLETLPNIDINIKCGNSLISRFKLDTSLKQALKKYDFTVDSYRNAVTQYKNAKSKTEKKSLEDLITAIKTDLRTEILYHDPKAKTLENLKVEVRMLELPQTLLEETKDERSLRLNKLEKSKFRFAKLSKEIEEIKNNKIFEGAFEWRFEFPEVLNDEGDFIGFDAFIGNPPYIDSETMVNYGMEKDRTFISANYKYAKGNWDIYIPFFERAFDLIKPNGRLTYITPDKWITKPFGDEFRKQCLPNIYSITKVGRDVFESALVDSIITEIAKTDLPNLKTYTGNGTSFKEINNVKKSSLTSPFALDFLMSERLDFLHKVEQAGSFLSDLAVCESACATSDAYKLKEFLIEFDPTKNSADDFHRVVNTGTLDKYVFKWETKEMTYLKDAYSKPVVEKTKFKAAFGNSYFLKSNSKKIILKGLTKLDGALDLDGTIIPGKSTLVIPSDNVTDLKFLVALLNSQLSIDYIKEKYPSASYNGGIVFTKDMINRLPVNFDNLRQNKIIAIVDSILIKKSEDANADIGHDQMLLDASIYKLYMFAFEDFARFSIDINFSESFYASA